MLSNARVVIQELFILAGCFEFDLSRTLEDLNEDRFVAGVVHFNHDGWLLSAVGYEIIAVGHYVSQIDVVAVHDSDILRLLLIDDIEAYQVVAPQRLQLYIDIFSVSVRLQYNLVRVLALLPAVLVEAPDVVLDVVGVVRAHMQVRRRVLFHRKELDAGPCGGVINLYCVGHALDYFARVVRGIYRQRVAAA